MVKYSIYNVIFYKINDGIEFKYNWIGLIDDRIGYMYDRIGLV